MCGIAGVCNLNGEPVAQPLLRRMADSIAHRGPDGEGYYVDGSVGLAHRRLAIIDLSAAAHQPMMSENGNAVIVYNGEVYNFRELRSELEVLGHRFHSQTDSEVVLHAYEEWGSQCLHRFNGMYAFAVWDRAERSIFLARDRAGIKPLYWYQKNGVFVFGSEIKAILQHPAVSVSVCYEALNEYFTFQNIFTDVTLFEGIRLLPPGHYMSLSVDRGTVAIRQYWDYPFTGDVDVSADDAADRLYHLFVDAVTRQLVSDVPVGSYLSGGIDSGSVTSVAVRHLPRLTTFTGGFDLSSASGLELGFDERATAEVMANLLKTEHYEVVMHAGDMEHVLPDLVWHLEDLRVGQSYPNYYVARLASKFVKVVLSGVGGDELFGGYPWRYYGHLDCDGSEEYFAKYFGFWQRLVPDEEKAKMFNADSRTAIGDHSPFDVFRGVFDGWDGGYDDDESCVNASLYFELKTFLHGLLIMEDKLSMAHSLETRVPFLDNDLVDFATNVPVTLKLPNLSQAPKIDENVAGKRRLYDLETSDGKAVLRQAMGRLIPQEVTERAKQGFSAPDASWFRGESIVFINDLLRDPKASIYDYVRPQYVNHVLDIHCSGKENKRLLIWSLLCFEWWLRKFAT